LFPQPVEEVNAESTADRVPDRVTHHGADDGGDAHTDRVDLGGVVRGEQRGAHENDLTRQRNAETFQPDDRTHRGIHRRRWDGRQQRIHVHVKNNA